MRFVLPQFGALNAHHLDADADKPDVVDMRLDVRAGAGKTDPAAVGLWRREQSMPEGFRQVVGNDQFTAHEAVGLGIAGAFEAARREIQHQMTTHFVDHGLDILILAGLRRLLSQGDILAAAREIDQRRQEPRDRLAQHIVERRPQKRLLEPSLEMQQDIDNTVQESEKHRQSLPSRRSLEYRQSSQISGLTDARKTIREETLQP